MKIYKFISITFFITSLTLLVGCTNNNSTTNTESTNTDEVANINGDIGINANTNTTVNTNTEATDENINTEQESEVDASDWLTYTNEEYGFSFKYPKDWGEVMVDKINPDQFVQGAKIIFQFSKDSSIAIQGRSTAIINIETLDYELNSSTDGSDIPINKIDFTHTNDELASELKRHETTNLVVDKITISSVQGLLLHETATNLGGEEYKLIYYIIPKYNSSNSMNFIIYADDNIASILEKIVHTMVFSES